MTRKIKSIFNVLLILLIIINQGCNEEDCGECFTPPTPFLFELVDKTTGENLFTNGTYDPSEVEEINIVDGAAVGFSFIDENAVNIINIFSIGWKTEKVNLEVNISGVNIFNLYVDAERLVENCCSFTKYHEVKIENTLFEFDAQKAVYKILVE